MEWLWVLLIVLLLFGGAKLPSLAKGLGQSIREFKKASKETEEEIKSAVEDDEEKPAATSQKTAPAPAKPEPR